MLGELFKAFLITSLAGSVLALIITLLRLVTKRIFGYSWHYYIWLTVLFVMLLPVRFTLPQNNPDIPIVNMQTMQVQPVAQTTDITEIPQDVNKPPTKTATKKVTNFINLIIVNRLNYLSIIWLLGIAVMLGINISSYARLIKRIHKNSIVVDYPQIRNYTDKKITVRKGGELSSPFMLGVLRPTLVLPERELSTEQLDNILRHEMTHFRRKDILYKWFAVIVRCVHWFNPIAYFVARQINTECEISCDLSVTSRMSNSERISYVNTILSLVSSNRIKRVPLTTQMASGKKALKRRFTMIKNVKKTSKFMSALSAVALVLLFSISVTVVGLISGCSDIGSTKSIIAQNSAHTTENVVDMYLELYGIADGEYVYTTDDFCMALPSGIKLEKYDLNGQEVNGIESVWGAGFWEGEIEINVRDEIVDVPENEMILKQRLSDTPWLEDEISPYETGEYAVGQFEKVAYPNPTDSGSVIIGYRYAVSLPDGRMKYIQRIPIYDTKTLRTVANINTSDENIKQNFVDIVKSVKTTEIIKAAYSDMNK